MVRRPLSRFPDVTVEGLIMTGQQELTAFLCSTGFTEAEKFIVRAQYPELLHLGSFERRLWDLLCVADATNLERLARAFPAEVAAARAWWHGNLGHRIRAAGLDI